MIRAMPLKVALAAPGNGASACTETQARIVVPLDGIS
jgi:hypothetical protein